MLTIEKDLPNRFVVKDKSEDALMFQIVNDDYRSDTVAIYNDSHDPDVRTELEHLDVAINLPRKECIEMLRHIANILEKQGAELV